MQSADGKSAGRSPVPRSIPRSGVRAALVLLVLLVLVGVGSYALVVRPGWTSPADDGARSHWQQALDAFDASDFLGAKTHLARCLDVWPINAEAHFLMARSCRRAGDSAGWQTHLRKAEILQWPKEALDLERLLMRAQTGDVRSVEDTLLDYVDSRPDEEVLILEALVKGYLETDRLDDVLDLTTQWIERHPDHWQPRLFRARAFQLGRSLARAVADYRRVLELKADHAQAHFELAGALMVNSQFQEALEHFQTYLGRHPDDPAALVGVANCQLSLGQAEAARATLDRLFAEHKEHAAGFFVRAKVELALNGPEAALGWLKRAEALAPHETDITYTLVLALQRLGKHEEAQKYEGKLHKLRRQFDRWESVKKQIRKEPDNVSLRHEAGAMALSLGRDEEAGHWLESALRLDPNHAPTHQSLADYFQRLGDSRRAAYHRRRAAGTHEAESGVAR